MAKVLRLHSRTSVLGFGLVVSWFLLTRSPATAEERREDAAGQKATAPNAESQAAAGGREWTNQDGNIPVHGFFSFRYRGRWTDRGTEDEDASDNDGYASLGLDIGREETQPVTFHFLGRTAADFDGKGDRRRLFVFDSIDDTYSSDATVRLYRAHADLHFIPGLETVRLGRQLTYETPETAYFDGGFVDTDEWGIVALKLGAYAGVPVHLFESSPDGDLLGGAFLQAKPWSGNRIRGDWMHAEDEQLIGEQHKNDLFGVSGWQNVTDYVQFHANYTRLEDHNRDMLFRITVQSPEWDFKTQLSYYELLRTQRDFAIEFDPFFTSNLEAFPYYQIRWLASKGLGEHLVVEGGLDARQVWNAPDIGVFNREYDRYYLTLTTIEFPVEGMSLSLTGDYWDSEEREIAGVGGDVTQQCTEKLKVSAGSFYSRFRYDFLSNIERDDVRTYYGKIAYKFTKGLKADVRYEYEDDDFEQYHQVRLGFQWSF